MKARLIQWLLDHLDCDHLLTNIHRRGWVPVPKEYATKTFPANVKTGWWPHLGAGEAPEYFVETKPK